MTVISFEAQGIICCLPHDLQEATMKDNMANNSTASISQARKAVEQLKMEACMDRIKVHIQMLHTGVLQPLVHDHGYGFHDLLHIP